MSLRTSLAPAACGAVLSILLTSSAALAAAPLATTSAASSVTATTAQLNGLANPKGEATTGWFRHSTTNPGTCDDGFGTRVPGSGGTAVGAGSFNVAYSVSTSGLAPGTPYFFCAIVSNASGTAFGAVLSFTTPALAPTVTTSAATNLTSSTATFQGSANPNGSATTGFFRFSGTNPGACSNTFGTRIPAAAGTALGAGNSVVAFTEVVPGLLAGATYYYCAIATNGLGTTFGNILSFTTLIAAPTVTTSAATSITGTTVTLNGTANPNGAAATGWYRYSATNPGGCNDAFGTRQPFSGGSNLGAGSFALGYAQSGSGLVPGTTYYFCAIANNSVGTSFGAVLTFTTPATPSVTTSAASAVLATTATLNGAANPNGASASGWYRYSPSNPGTCNDSFGTVTATTFLGAGNTDVPYNRPIGGLLPGTTYYFCAIANNSVGTSFGTLLTLTTPPTAPLVNTQTATAVTGTTATLNGTANPGGDATTGWLRYSTTTPGTCSDSFGTRAPAAGGTGLGSGNAFQPYAEPLTGLLPGTTYYFCAIANNAVGTSFGTVLSFITPNVPVVTTSLASSVLGTTATLNGTGNPNGALATGWFRYATTSPGTCNDSFGVRAPFSSGTNLGSGSSALSYAQNVTGLTPGTTYFFCAIASNAVGTGFGAVSSFVTPSVPTVTSAAATTVTATTATLNGAANPNGAAATGWYRYATIDPVTCNDSFGLLTSATSMGAGTTAVPYARAIGGLLPGTTYFFCAISGNSVGTGFGAVLSFTTPPTAPIVSTFAATAVTGTSATLNGSANPRGAASTGWYRLDTTNPGACNDTFGTRIPAAGGTAVGSGNTTASFTEALTGLVPGTTYYFCAVANNAVGTSFGGLASFSTPNVPSVTTVSVTAITGTTATFNANANPNGGAANGWLRYATTNPVTCNDSFGVRAPFSGGIGLGGGTSAVSYSQNVSGLTPGTTYYFCAVASNLVGTGFGAVLSFTTPAAPTVVTLAATGISATAATLNATANPNGGAATGWLRYATVDPVTCNDTFGTRAPASGGTALGAGNTAAPYSVNPATLSPGTTYFFCAVASNLVGTSFGTVLSFTTPPTAPLVVTSTASLVTSGSARLNGSTNPRGAAATGWFRYSPTDPGTCNDSFGIRAPAAAGAALGPGNAYVAHLEDLTGLALATPYYFCAIASNAVGMSFGSVVSFTTAPAAPLVTTLAAAGVTTSAATMNATATPNGAPSTGWFRFSLTAPASCNDTFDTRVPASGGTALGAGTSTVPYSVNPTTLSAGVTYHYCAVASNSAGTSFGAVLTFTTVSTPPTLTTLAATSIGGTTATLNGSANPNGDSTLAWFRYATTSPGSCNDTFGTRFPATGGSTLGSGAVAAPFSQALAALVPGSTYYFCAIAQNSNGTSLGAVLTFNTPNAPAVTTNAASPVNATTATLNATAAPNGTAATGWFRYSAINPGTCDDTFGIRAPTSGGTSLGSGGAAVAYANALTGLQPGTAYFFCALSSNAVGTSFGALLSFTTPPTAPLVSTLAATNLTSTAADLNGSANPNGAATTGWFRYSTVNPGSCNDSFGTRAPATGGTALGAGTAALGFTQTVTGLSTGTTYFFCPIAQNVVGTSFSGVLSFVTPGAPVVITSPPTAVATASATLNGSGNPNRDATTGYFRYSATNPGTCDDAFGTRAPAAAGTSLGAGSAALPFSQAVTGLAPSTTYFFCAIGANGIGTSFGAVLSFTTLSAPTVATAAPTALTTTTGTLNGSAVPNGTAATGWFRYSTVSPVTCNDTFGIRAPSLGGTALGAGGTAVAFSRAITGLVSGTTYYACAIASNASGTAFGSVVSFSTVGPPSVTTLAASGVSTNAATLNGSANPNNGAATGWFRYSPTNPFSCTTTFGIRTPASGGTVLGASSADVPYSASLTGLMPSTPYYFCAQALNASGTSVGALLTFTTPATPLAPTVVTSTATAVTGTTASLNGSANPRADATTAWFRISTTNPGACSDTFGTRAPLTGGTSVGSGSSAVPVSLPVTGLVPGLTHYFCAIASNAVGTSFGAVLTFTTPAAPAVTSAAASAVTGASATLNGAANPNAAAATGYFRYSAADPGSCNDTFGTRAPASSGTALGAGITPVAYFQPIAGLTSSTTYFFCAIAANFEGTSFGAVLSFTTPTAPAVMTLAATAVTGSSATLNGSANPNGSATTGWLRYSAVNPGACSDTFGSRLPISGGTALGSGSSAAAFSQSAGLAAGTTYYFCAIASNAVGTSFGAVLTVTTPAAPAVLSLAATAVTSSAASLNGSANPGGDATTGHYRFSPTNPGSCNDSFGTRAPATGGTALGAGNTAAPYSELASGLAPATTYYFCAIAVNAVGTGFGAVLSFTTTAGPAVTTAAASAITGTAATLNGSANPRMTATTGWFRYSTTNPGGCDDSFGTRAPTAGGTSLGAGSTDVPYSQALTGLTAGTTYYYCAIASNPVGTSFGTVLSFIAPAAPAISTAAATLVTGSTATLNGAGIPNGAATTGWLRYSATTPGACTDTFGIRAPAAGGSALGAGGTSTPFAQAISGLAPGTTYFFCAIGSNSEGTTLGALLSFTTPTPPAVTTLAATAVTSSAASLNGSANPNGSAATGWLRYSATNPGACDDTFGTRAPATGSTALGAGTTAAPFSQSVTGLAAGTAYFFCAISSNPVGTSFGAVLTFTTPATAPVVTTLAATGVSSSGGTLNGSASAGGAVADAWFRYSTTNPGSCNDTFGTRSPAVGGTSLGSGTAVVAFSQALSGLPLGATYFYCAFASNPVGTSFGMVLSFTPATAPVLTTTAATGIGGTTATFNGTANPNGSATTGWFRFSATDPVTCTDTFGTRSPAIGGTSIGSGSAPSAYSQAAAGLVAGTTYYFCAVGSNGAGTAFGAVLSFRTPAAPAVMTSSASDVMGTLATLNGSANPNGADATGWYRYATTNPGTCNDTFGVRTPPSALGAGTTPVGWSQVAAGLTPGATYYFCAIASNTVGTSFGAVLVVTIDAPAPVVTTQPATLVEARGGVLNGLANPNGSATNGWFRYGTTKPVACDDTFGTRVPAMGGLPLGAGASAMSFTLAVTDLKPNLAYHFCAIASNAGGAAFGDLLTFSTATAPPTVTTLDVTMDADGRPELNARGNPNGSSAVGTFRYGTENPGTCTDTFGVRAPDAGISMGAGHDPVPFKQPLGELAAGATYFYCAVVTTPAGTALGELKQFEVPAGQGKGCGCGSGGSAASLLALALVLLARAKRRA